MKPNTEPITMHAEGFEALATVLQDAFLQASAGKGQERHGNGLPFTQQPILELSRMIGSRDGLVFQAMKKLQESQRMPSHAARRELLGAIVYTAAAVIHLDEQEGGAVDAADRVVYCVQRARQFGADVEASIARRNEAVDALVYATSATSARGPLAEQVAKEGWVEWGGGACPVNPASVVEYQMRGGAVHVRLAHELAWCHVDKPWDIVAYRLVNPANDNAKCDCGMKPASQCPGCNN